MINLKIDTLKPQYSEQVCQTLSVHYIELFTTSNVICLVNPQNGSWVLFTILRNSLYRGLLYRGMSVVGIDGLVKQSKVCMGREELWSRDGGD